MHIKQRGIAVAEIVLNGLAAGLLTGRTKDVSQRSRYSILLPFLCVKAGENEQLHVASLTFAETSVVTSSRQVQVHLSLRRNTTLRLRMGDPQVVLLPRLSITGRASTSAPCLVMIHAV